MKEKTYSTGHWLTKTCLLLLFIFLWNTISHAIQINDCGDVIGFHGSTGGEMNYCTSQSSNSIMSSENGSVMISTGYYANALHVGFRRERNKPERALENRIKEDSQAITGLIKEYAESTFPLVVQTNGKLNIIGSAYRYNSYYITALHVVANMNRDIFIREHGDDGELKKVQFFSAPQEGEISPYQDLVLLSLENDKEEISIDDEWDFAKPTENGTYVNLGFPRGESNITKPNSYSGGFYSQTETEDNLIILNRVGQNNGSSGGLILDLEEEKPVGLVLCIVEKVNTIRGIKLASIEEDFIATLQNPKNFVSSISDRNYEFTYESDGCDPIGDRGLLGDTKGIQGPKDGHGKRPRR